MERVLVFSEPYARIREESVQRITNYGLEYVRAHEVGWDKRDPDLVDE
jgi:hypothetical protein